MTLNGLTARIESDGSVALADATDRTVMRIPAGYMEDSLIDPRTGAPAQSAAVTYQLITVAGGPALRVTADRAWLADPARVYPVRVDPSFTTNDTGDIYVDSDSSTTNHNGHDLPVGTFNGGGVVARSFIHFDNFNNDFGGTRILAASLKLFHTWSYDCNHLRSFSVHKVTEAWTVAALTNNAGLAAGPSYTSAIGSLTTSTNSPACTNSSAIRSVGSWVSVPMNTGTFNGWSVTPSTNLGLALTASETDSYGWKRFTSANYSSGSYAPYLDITYAYNEYPQVDDQYPGYGQAVTTLRPELLAIAHDPDEFPKSLTYKFIVYNKDNVQISTSNWISSRSWVVPAGVLTWGESYYWSVIVSDGLEDTASYQVKYLMVTPVPQPLVTSGLSQNSNQGFEPSIGNYTTSARDAMVATAGPALEIRRSYNSQDPRTAQAFGAGWSSVADARVTQRFDTANNVVTVVVTYPSGREMAFGRNSTGSFSPPSGHFATFTEIVENSAVVGYQLVEKDGTTYVFRQSLGSGQFGVTSIADVAGRTQTFAYAANQLTQITAASGRSLHLTWVTSAGASPHVATVATDPTTPGDPATANTWTYTYGGDTLTTVCPPTSTIACTTYNYTDGSLYQTAVANAGPHSYWRLNETTGTVAASSVIENAGADNGTYKYSTLGQPGPLAGSQATAAGFDGSTTRVVVPANLVSDASYQAVSLWFKTGSGSRVLYGQSWDQVVTEFVFPTTTRGYHPTLYVGTDGKLMGGFPTVQAAGSLGSLQGAASGRCLEVAGNSSTNGARIQLADCTGATHQQWTMTVAGELRVTSGGVVKCMDVANSATTDGTDIRTWSCNGTPAQEWTVRPNGNIVGAGSDKCLDAEGAATAVGTKIQLWSCGSARNNHRSWFPRTHTPMQSTAAVADNAWHHVILTASGTSQTMYVDGVQVASQTGITVQDMAAAYSYVGGGYLGGGWPNQSYSSTTKNTGTRALFSGSIAEVALFDKPLSAQTVTDLYAARVPVKLLTSVVRPSGNPTAAVTYDGITGRVSQVLDGNGSTWAPQPAQVQGTTKIYESAVLAGAPADYWRLAESGGIDAVNEVNGGTASYNSVTLGVTNGPFANVPDATVASFNGISSYLRLPTEDIPTTCPCTMSMWFKMPSGSTAGGVLFGYQEAPMSNLSAAGSWTPALYIGTDGKLRGEFWVNMSSSPITSTTLVNDGKWHHVALSASTNSQTLYLDGKGVGTINATILATTALYAYVGAGKWSGSWPAHGTSTAGYFPGQLAEVAYYRSQLDAAQIQAQFAARVGVNAAYGVTFGVVEPGGAQSKDIHDLLRGRKVAEVDARGYTTRYGYNSKGYLRTLTDPNGNVTINERDARGNLVSTTTCQDRSANQCSTWYYTYYLDPSVPPALDPRNDRVLTEQVPGSTALTTYTYDSAGNRTSMTDPANRKTTISYTDGTTVAAYDSGFAPPGLPAVITKPGGGTQRFVYYANGDLATSTDPAGTVLLFEYDALGRTNQQIEVVNGVPGAATTFTHDRLDRVATRTDPAVTNRVTGAVHTAVTTTVYNDDGLPESETVSDTTGGDASRTVTFGYDSHGRRTSETDALGKTLQFGYDPYGRINEQTYADATVIVTNLDPLGNEETVVLKNYTGDPLDPTDPEDLTLRSMAYDPAGRLASATDAMGWVTSYTYTDNGLLATVTRSDPSTGASYVHESNSYDEAGNLFRQATNNGLTTTIRTFDAVGRALTATLDPSVFVPFGPSEPPPLNRTTTHTYSPDDDVTTTTLSDSSGVVGASETLYDPLGRVLAQTTYRNPGLTPIGRWRLDETSGTTAGDSAGNSAATATGGVTWSTEHGGSAIFDGAAGTAMTTAGPLLDTARSYTTTAWVKLTDNTASKAAVSQDGSQRSGFALGYDLAQNKWRMFICDPDSTSPCTSAFSTSTPALGSWVHLVGVYDATAGQSRLYVNGQLEGTATVAAQRAARGPFAVGQLKSNGVAADHWPGSISDVQAYSKALTATEISQVYAGTAPAANTGVIRTSYTLDRDGSVTSVTAPDGTVTYVSSDEVGRPVVITSPPVSTVVGEGTPVTSVAVSRVGYNTFGEAVERQDPNGNVTTLRYDALGRVDQVVAPSYTPPGSATPLVPTTTHVYNDVGQLTSTEDPLGGLTSYVYDQLGRVVRVTAPDLGVSRFAYDLNGELLSHTDPTGAKVTTTSDYLGRTLTSTQVVRQSSASYTTTFSYGSGTWPSAVTTPAGVTTSFTYNKAGERLTLTDEANNTTATTYDGAGRPIRVTAPDNTYGSATYDLAGRAVSMGSHSAGGTLLRSTSVSYDRAGNVATSTDGRGTTTTFGYDAIGRLTSQVEPINGSDSITSTFGYDLAGQQTRFVDGRGNQFVTTYNSWGLPHSQIEPDTTTYPGLADRTFAFAYDIGGRLVRADSPGGVSVASTYDSMGRLERSVGTGALATTIDRTFGYDQAGRMTSFSGSAGTTSVTYDDRSLPLTVTGVSGASSYAYTSDGQLESRIDAAGTTNYTFDPVGRLATTVNTAAGVNLGYTYNSLSQLDTITHGVGGNVRDLDYDSLHRLTKDELKDSGGVSLAKITYGWDNNDNLTSKTTTGFTAAATNTYTYDLADRLIGWDNGVTPVVYAYDKSGNRVQAGTRTFAYDERNQLASSSDGTTYHYSARGTLVQTMTGSGMLDTVTDAFGQVTSQTAPGGGPSTYSYDGLGRVIQSGLSYTGLANTVAGDGTATYVRGPDDGLVGVVSGGTQRYAWIDAHTDVVGEYTATGTSLTGSVAYDPYGAVLGSTGTLGKLGYQSQWTDQGTGRVNMWARWYNPETGAFDTRDDVNLSATPNSMRANRFTYAEGNPLTNTDPTGHMVERGDGSPKGCEEDDYACQLKRYEREVAQHERDMKAAGTEIARQEAEYQRAEQESRVDLFSILLQVGIGMILDMIGYTSAVGCFANGSLWDCVDLVSNFIGPLKIFKLGKSLYRAIERGIHGYKMWKRIIDGANAAMRRASDLMNQARKHLNDLVKKKPKKPKAPRKKPKPPAKPKPKAKPVQAKPKPSKPAAPPRPKPAPRKVDRPDNGKPRGDDGPRREPERAREPRPEKRGCAGTETHSFDPATRVLMADGSTRPISEVGIGDRVAATDPVSGESSGQSVTMLHLNRDTKLTDVTVSSAPAATGKVAVGEGDGDRSTRGPTTTTLHSTQNHPFWDATSGSWVDAAELVPGVSTLVGPDGQLQYVVAVRSFTGSKDMRDLTINRTHTYYVVAATTPVLVHNNNGDVCGIPGGDVDDGTIGRLEAHVDTIIQSGVGKRRRPGTVGETIGVRSSGLLVVVQTQSGVSGRLPGRLFQALTACGHTHGGCSEVSGIARILEFEATPIQTTAMGVMSKRIGREWHRKTMDPCPSCMGLLNAFGMTWRR